MWKSKGQNQVKISNRFAALENRYDDVESKGFGKVLKTI